MTTFKISAEASRVLSLMSLAGAVVVLMELLGWSFYDPAKLTKFILIGGASFVFAIGAGIQFSRAGLKNIDTVPEVASAILALIGFVIALAFLFFGTVPTQFHTLGVVMLGALITVNGFQVFK